MEEIKEPEAINTPNQQFVAAAERAVGAPLHGWTNIAERGGLSSANRWLAATDDDKRVFLKSSGPGNGYFGTETEIRTYESLAGQPWLPIKIGHDSSDPEVGSVLALEDLSDCDWPPPWSSKTIDGAREVIELVAVTPAPDWIPSIEKLDPEFSNRWPHLLDRPTEIAATGICSLEWIKANISDLVASAARFKPSGTALCHLDLWSDNISFRSNGDVLITDWTDVCLANPKLMLGIWAGNTSAESDRIPEELIEGEPGLASFMASRGIERLVNPPDWMNDASTEYLRDRLAVLLPWAARDSAISPDPHWQK